MFCGHVFVVWGPLHRIQYPPFASPHELVLLRHSLMLIPWIVVDFSWVPFVLAVSPLHSYQNLRDYLTSFHGECQNHYPLILLDCWISCMSSVTFIWVYARARQYPTLEHNFSSLLCCLVQTIVKDLYQHALKYVIVGAHLNQPLILASRFIEGFSVFFARILLCL